ncbi:molecular chaperone DnaK [Mesotoga sp. Brook.08.YT.4.2.5.1]|uniref:molecular chaperone DnaK n=1 Tax=unclassified Mesotoga TaxID=1184398 RepID=UPI000C19637E|nr:MULTISPECIES: molecular chaperone DnaK [unclassified Mesotoga]PNE20055.1 molecular chaperone DnaK [Mesotoga sp. Brook.08.YT.4.2.5.1]PVD16877.1 molecular chaperone DnaK [Mesotoga sp. Brook.08.105.5.1]RAO97318.1 molecular chaperone DnaK [Mesotoga sp. Brook.08.YT.4.2.5.4.]RDI91587.1 molecular chaperone DnaK [Mesotoga sp. Brook.08.YT.4.2.5.2.]
MANKEYTVGIDLGTTNSVISWVKPDGNVEVIPNAEGNRTTPSIVSFSKTGEIIVGEPAKRQTILNADRTVRSVKRKMGSDYKVKIDDKEYTPQEISAYILKKMKADAEAYLGGKITQAVITCPAYFNDAQRQATKEAGIIAGLEVQRIINEPTAAAVAYGIDKKRGDKKIIVYDLGGGTFDVSVLDIGDGVVEVLSTSGNNHLGGDDFDQRLIDHIAEDFRKKNNVDLRKDKQAFQRLKDAAERAKIELSSKFETEISLPFITATADGPLHLEMKITRSTLESLIKDLVEGTREQIERAMSDAKLSPKEIDEVLLVGGSTRIPMVQSFIKSIFGKDPNKNINPDEAVAIGAALQSGILSGSVESDLVLVDVTPLTLGVEVMGGLMEPIIERNSTVPVKRSKVFTTAADGQTEVEVAVYQGERTMARDNMSLGSFKLTGIAPAPRGVPQIEVTFDIDSDGIVHVSAKDLGTNREQSMVVSGRQKMSEEEIKRVVEEAKKYEEQDKQKKQEIELKNQADQLAYSIDKLLSESGDKISSEDRGKLEGLVKDLRDAINEDNIQRIKLLFDQLQKESMRVGQSVYQKAQAQTPADGVPQEGDNNDSDSGTEYIPPEDSK